MPGTLTDRFDVANLDQWGRLIKSWATNLDYVTQDYPFQPPRAFWVNTTWPQEAAGPPSAETVPDRDQKNNPQAWTLPQMKPVNVEGTNDTYVALPFAVALSSVEFTDRLTAASVVGVHMPTQYKNVIVVQGDKDTMVIRLPPRDTTKGSYSKSSDSMVRLAAM